MPILSCKNLNVSFSANKLLRGKLKRFKRLCDTTSVGPSTGGRRDDASSDGVISITTIYIINRFIHKLNVGCTKRQGGGCAQTLDSQWFPWRLHRDDNKLLLDESFWRSPSVSSTTTLLLELKIFY